MIIVILLLNFTRFSILLKFTRNFTWRLINFQNRSVMDFEKERKSHYFKVSKVFHGETVEKNENPSRVVHKYQYSFEILWNSVRRLWRHEITRRLHRYLRSIFSNRVSFGTKKDVGWLRGQFKRIVVLHAILIADNWSTSIVVTDWIREELRIEVEKRWYFLEWKIDALCSLGRDWLTLGIWYSIYRENFKITRLRGIDCICFFLLFCNCQYRSFSFYSKFKILSFERRIRCLLVIHSI